MKKWVFIIVILFLAISFDVDAQCAMCKANVESNQQNAGDISSAFGNGLNNGILYLMAVPYFFLMSVIYLIFRERINSFFKERFSFLR